MISQVNMKQLLFPQDSKSSGILWILRKDILMLTYEQRIKKLIQKHFSKHERAFKCERSLFVCESQTCPQKTMKLTEPAYLGLAV